MAKSPPPSGLEGVVVGETRISLVDGEKGIILVRGYPAVELSERVSYEQVAHLLLRGELPSPRELEAFTREWFSLRPLPKDVATLAGRMPADMLPMEALRTGMSLMGAGATGWPPSESDVLPIMARAPTWLAAWYRARRGLPPVDPDPSLGQIEHYLYLLAGERPQKDRARALEEYCVLLSEHGMNASTFAARVVLATQSDVASAMSAGVGTLKGPLHGGAPSLVLDMLDRIGEPGRAPDWIAQALARRDRLMGFGHRVYRREDPRSARLKQIAKRIARPERYALAEAVESAGLEALRKARPDRPMYPNVEFYAAVLMEAAGLPRELFPAMFAIARTAGWSAHLLEQGANNRILRPDVEYLGPPRRTVPVRRGSTG